MRAEEGAWTTVTEDGRGGGSADAVALGAGDMGDELLLEVHSDALELAAGRVPVADVWAVRQTLWLRALPCAALSCACSQGWEGQQPL